jgi:hypothetical protein
MASFGEADRARLDFLILQNGWAQLYWKIVILEEDCRWLSEHGYRLVRLDCSAWRSEEDALVDFGKRLDFPAYYGCNQNALVDCLRDVSVPASGGLALVLVSFDSFLRREAPVAESILDILANASRDHMLFGRRVLTLLQSDDPQISLADIGATSVPWNRKEWLTSTRRV